MGAGHTGPVDEFRAGDRGLAGCELGWSAPEHPRTMDIAASVRTTAMTMTTEGPRQPLGLVADRLPSGLGT